MTKATEMHTGNGGHSHVHDDAMQQQVVNAIRTAHNQALDEGYGCEFINAYLHHAMEILVAMPPDAQDRVLAELAEQANQQRLDEARAIALLRARPEGTA